MNTIRQCVVVLILILNLILLLLYGFNYNIVQFNYFALAVWLQTAVQYALVYLLVRRYDPPVPMALIFVLSWLSVFAYTHYPVFGMLQDNYRALNWVVVTLFLATQYTEVVFGLLAKYMCDRIQDQHLYVHQQQAPLIVRTTE